MKSIEQEDGRRHRRSYDEAFKRAAVRLGIELPRGAWEREKIEVRAMVG